MKKFLYWLPRILSILITAFWAYFVLASHGLSITTFKESGIWVALLVFTILAWRGQIIGKVGFLVMGLLYMIMTRGKMPYLTVFIVAGPVVLVGILYFLDNFSLKKKIPLNKIKELINTNETDDSELI